MARIWRVFLLITVAIAAFSSAATAIAASGRPAGNLTRTVAAHVRVKATIPVGNQPFGSPWTRRPRESTWPTSAAARCR